jgi:hypothetical protein
MAKLTAKQTEEPVLHKRGGGPGATPVYDWGLIEAEMRHRLHGQEPATKSFFDEMRDWCKANPKSGGTPKDSSFKRHLYGLGYHSERGVIRKVRSPR